MSASFRTRGTREARPAWEDDLDPDPRLLDLEGVAEGRQEVPLRDDPDQLPPLHDGEGPELPLVDDEERVLDRVLRRHRDRRRAS